MYINDIDISGLKTLCDSKPVASHIFDYLVSYQRSDYEILVEELQDYFHETGRTFARQDIIDIFKELEKFGCGEFVAGRRTKKSRFKARFPLNIIGQQADETEPSQESSQKSEYEEQVSIAKQISQNNENITQIPHSFALRPNFHVELKLPINFTDSEAERLCKFIKTLPFGN